MVTDTLTEALSLPGRDHRHLGGDWDTASLVAKTLEAALRARAPELHSSTMMVRKLSVQVCRQLGLDERAQALVSVCARVRDVGMMALPDAVVLATDPLSAADWEILNQHPVVGSELLASLPAMEGAAAVVRSHHERWDGAGYPDGKHGEETPILSRVIAACDAFVAMAGDRPYRRGIGAEAALEHIRLERGSQFDPLVVDALVTTVLGRASEGQVTPRIRRITGGVSNDLRNGNRHSDESGKPAGIDSARRSRTGPRELKRAIVELDVLPAFRPAHERALTLAASGVSDSGELINVIESDIGLTAAILRRSQCAGGKSVTNVLDAVSELTMREILDSINELPVASFPWQTAVERMLHHSRVHAQAVARAADRIGREALVSCTDDVVAVALLHDVGKLAIARALPGYEDATDARSLTAEIRVRRERQALGLDHASLGGLLLERWGLPSRISAVVAAHHTSAEEGEFATIVRLADLVARHAQGDAVDRRQLLRLAAACGLSARMLRDVLFDLPRSGGSQRRRAQPSPLSSRETAVLRLLADGDLYKEIALKLGLSQSTVRTHLHHVYRKLEVADRAQAVLRATEMGWL